MIEIIDEDFFKVIREMKIGVIPVNLLGVAGAGIALGWKEQYPLSHVFYKEACSTGRPSIAIGRNYVIRNVDELTSNPPFFFCLPTKDHYKKPSQLDYLEKGLDDLVIGLEAKEAFDSCCLPALGCGKGKLLWQDVRELMVLKLSVLKKKKILICTPR